ncbi:MAG: PP2C family protein-serine/threonine phosphatase [Lachnospiraceae bacterium]|nr:PP2C family protein-serine/threonine phosphatase [Lachnospiraceae bacterium]
MNFAMPLVIFFFLLPTLICKITGAEQWWVKYALIFSCILAIFVLSSAMSKHGVLTWTLPLMLSCHYYSPKLTKMTLVLSWIFFLPSLYIALFFGEWDQNLLNAGYYSGERIVTSQNVYETTLYFVFTRIFMLLGISVICTTLSKRTRIIFKRQIADSEEHQRISTELDVATQIQADMLPSIFPAFPDRPEFDIYATMNPAKEVGGDFYDFFMLDNKHLAIVMADVSGKGVPAALFMVIGKTLIKDHTKSKSDLGDVFTEVNNILCESNSAGLFITAFEGVLNLVTGEFRFVNAGHEMPFIAKGGGVYEPYKINHGFVLAGMEGMKYTGGSMQLAPGDKIFQYTDGVTEATNAAQELYGMDRLSEILAKNTALKPTELLTAVKADIDAFVGDAPQFDDITMLCLEYLKAMSQ